jgi:integrase
MAGGIDPKAGRTTVRRLLPVWLEERRTTVSQKTYVSDSALPRLVPPSLAALSIVAVTDREVQRALVLLTKDGYAEASVRRFRASLSSFFACAVRERMIVANPVLRTRVPRAGGPRTEMYPFSEADLEAVYAHAVERLAAAGQSSRLADVLLVAAWTGLRWSELRAIRVRDFAEVPMPLLVVQLAEPEGSRVKGTKSGKTRRVPVADRILPLVREMAADREAEAHLFVTPSGHRLHASAFKRTLGWPQLARGRRIHDLRHTAACLWLARGVDPMRCRPGWDTPRSRRRTSTCTTSGRRPTGPD